MDETWFQMLKITVYFAAAAFGGFMAGLFPSAVALKRGNTKYAKISMAVCIPTGLLGGFAAALLVALVLIVVVLKRTPIPSQRHVHKER